MTPRQIYGGNARAPVSLCTDLIKGCDAPPPTSFCNDSMLLWVIGASLISTAGGRNKKKGQSGQELWQVFTFLKSKAFNEAK